MKTFILLFFVSFLSVYAYGEGTRELRPQPGDNGFLFLSNDNTYTRFGQYNAPEEQQIKLRIEDPAETIWFGFNNQLESNGNFTPNVEFRILDPNGNVVLGPQNFPTNGNPGFINNYNEAINGPQQVVGAGGYNALQFDPGMTGDYVIEFDISGIPANDNLFIDLFDITVEDPSGNSVKGRLHSEGWQLTTGAFTNGFYGNVYPRGRNGVVYNVDFNGMQPFSFVLNFNSYGVQQTGDPIVDRRSRSVGGSNDYTAPGYEVFLNPPDSSVYPTDTTTVTFDGLDYTIDCDTRDFCLNYSSSSDGLLEGYIDVDGDGSFDSTAGDVYFHEEFSTDTTKCIPWDGRDAHGNIVNDDNLQIYSRFGYAPMHLPLFDVEDNTNGFSVSVERPGYMDDPDLYWDDVRIQNKAGNNLDGIRNLNGCASTGGNGCHQWEGRGQDNSNSEIINSWWYSNLIRDTITLDASVNQPVDLSYNPNSIVDHDSTVCRGDSVAFFVYDNGPAHYDTSRYQYKWYLNGSLTARDTMQQKFRIDASTTVVIRSEDERDTTCFTEDTIRVFTVPPVKVSATVQDEKCRDDGSISVNVNKSPPGPVFDWQEFPDSSSSSLSGLPDGTYHVNVFAPGFEGRCALDTFFTVAPATQISIDSVFSRPSSCFKGRTGEAGVRMVPVSNSYTYAWSGPGGNYGDRRDVDSLAVGTHHVRITDTNGCEVDTSIPVKGTKTYNVDKAPEYCSNSEGSIHVKAGPLAEISWEDNTSLKTFFREGLNTGLYHFKLTNPTAPVQCKVDTQVVVSNKTESVKADFVFSSPGSQGDYDAGEKVFFTNESQGEVDSSHWRFGDGASSTAYEPSHVYSDSGRYIITLDVTSPHGCHDRARKAINIANPIPCNIAMPNAFSPNGDGENEDIGVLGNVKDIELTIFNRWGEPVFRTTNREERWDGTYRGERSPVGVYPYVLRYSCPEDDKWHRKVGQITLVR